MGRFSKLETHRPDTPSPETKGSVLPAGFGTRRGGKPGEALPPGPDYDARHYQTEGDRHFYHGEYQKALRMYSRAISAEHSVVEPWIGQVRCLLEMEQAKEAMIWVKRALELFPEDPRLISMQGLAYAAAGMVERALACSDFALGRPGQPSGDPLVWIARGAVLSLADSPNADLCFCKAMETRARDDWHTPLSLGLLMLRHRKWTRAADFLDAAAQANPGNDFIWERLGWARERLGLGGPALEAYQAALHLNASNRAAQAGMDRLQHSSLWTRLARRIFNR